MLASLLWHAVSNSSLFTPALLRTHSFLFPRNPQNLSQPFHRNGVKTCFLILSEYPAFTAVRWKEVISPWKPDKNSCIQKTPVTCIYCILYLCMSIVSIITLRYPAIEIYTKSPRLRLHRPLSEHLFFYTMLIFTFAHDDIESRRTSMPTTEVKGHVVVLKLSHGHKAHTHAHTQ